MRPVGRGMRAEQGRIHSPVRRMCFYTIPQAAAATTHLLLICHHPKSVLPSELACTRLVYLLSYHARHAPK